MFETCQLCNRGGAPTSFGFALNRSCPGAIRAPSSSENSGANPAAGASHSRRALFLRRLSMSCARAANGRHYPKPSAVPAPFTNTFSGGGRRDFSCACGVPDWPSMTEWKASPGNGKVWMARKAKRRWHKKRWETTRPIGGKKGTKRSLLVDGRGAPLSLIVAGANRHDVKLLAQTLDAIVVRRPKPTRNRPQHLCVDKGYAGQPAEQQMRARGYTPHVPVKGTSKARHRRQGKARRWVVERTHSWINNYRKLRVRYEKQAANFEALLHLATAIICWRM
jgi:transposase